MNYQNFFILLERKKKNLTQKELANALGFSGQFMGRIEKNEVDLPPHLIKQCAKALGIRPIVLIDFYTLKFSHDLKRKVLNS